MNILFTGHNCDVTDALKNHIKSKFSRVVKHNDRIMHAHFTLQVEKLTQTVKVDIQLPKLELHANESSDDMYKSIDKIIDKLIRLIDERKPKYGTVDES